MPRRPSKEEVAASLSKKLAAALGLSAKDATAWVRSNPDGARRALLSEEARNRKDAEHDRRRRALRGHDESAPLPRTVRRRPVRTNKTAVAQGVASVAEHPEFEEHGLQLGSLIRANRPPLSEPEMIGIAQIVAQHGGTYVPIHPDALTIGRAIERGRTWQRAQHAGATARIYGRLCELYRQIRADFPLRVDLETTIREWTPQTRVSSAPMAPKPPPEALRPILELAGDVLDGVDVPELPPERGARVGVPDQLGRASLALLFGGHTLVCHLGHLGTERRRVVDLTAPLVLDVLYRRGPIRAAELATGQFVNLSPRAVANKVRAVQAALAAVQKTAPEE